MSDIILKPRDLEIKKISTERYGEIEIVQLNFFTASNESFINEMREAGVQDFRAKDEKVVDLKDEEDE